MWVQMRWLIPLGPRVSTPDRTGFYIATFPPPRHIYVSFVY